VWTIIDSDKDQLATPLPVLDEALELSPVPAPKKSILAGVVYAMFSLLLVVILAAQYMAYHFQTLSKNTDLRPWLSSICQPGLCSLPPLSDISQIRSEELVLHTHPDLEDALILQMNFRNLAPFSQPLPAFDLVFTDIRGSTVAGRRFQPQDYMGVPGAGQADNPMAFGPMEVPAGALVMASLVFADPGTDAVNYLVTFASPDTANDHQ